MNRLQELAENYLAILEKYNDKTNSWDGIFHDLNELLALTAHLQNRSRSPWVQFLARLLHDQVKQERERIYRTHDWSDKITVRTDVNSETPMSLQDGILRVDWVNLGEGLSGDYDPNDLDDINLLRFDVYVNDGRWAPLENASYCTLMPADADPRILEKALRRIFKSYRDVLKLECPERMLRGLGQQLSWISEDDFRRKGKQK